MVGQAVDMAVMVVGMGAPCNSSMWATMGSRVVLHSPMPKHTTNTAIRVTADTKTHPRCRPNRYLDLPRMCLHLRLQCKRVSKRTVSSRVCNARMATSWISERRRADLVRSFSRECLDGCIHPSIHPSIKACHFISTLLLEFYLIQLIMIKTIQSSAIIGLAVRCSSFVPRLSHVRHLDCQGTMPALWGISCRFAALCRLGNMI
mmetsp:Transcript_123/g.341  ORF Transcript_123/g.341 Transcript_123/m.341 type:complete len:204 (-) Transcript_123:2188-2799(-)